jgi:hypothetical protein
MHWIGYDIGFDGKVGRNIFVVTEQVKYLAYLSMYVIMLPSSQQSSFSSTLLPQHVLVIRPSSGAYSIMLFYAVFSTSNKLLS